MRPDTKKQQNARKREQHFRPHTTTQNMRKSRNSKEFRDLSVAGAEGFEPSARGFGVDVEKAWANIQHPVFHAVEPFVFSKRKLPKVLMIY